MSDILAFRVLRGPQRLSPTLATFAYPPPATAVGLHTHVSPATTTFLQQLATRAGGSRAADAFVKSPQFLGGGAALPVWIRAVDAWLVARDNRAKPADLIAALPDTPAHMVAAPAWADLRNGLADSLVAATVTRSLDSAPRLELTRLVLIAA